MKLRISTQVRQKLADKHQVHRDEIVQCFCNREKGYLEDIREDHKTNPPSKWFIAETDFGRKLKIVFMMEEYDGEKYITIKTAYPPNQKEINIYAKYAQEEK